jgi:hypothetical protein
MIAVQKHCMPGVDHMLPDERSSAERTDLVVYVRVDTAAFAISCAKEHGRHLWSAKLAKRVADSDVRLSALPASRAVVGLYDRCDANVQSHQ